MEGERQARRRGSLRAAGGDDLLLELDPRLGRRVALEAAIRSAIQGGRLAPGARLPSSRTLARELRIARGTVTEAYAQLAAEGLVVSRPGAGTVVAPSLTHAVRAAMPRGMTAHAAPPLRHDLRPGVPDLSAFPRAAWLRATREVLRSAPDAALGYGDPRGAAALREQLAGYLARARGVVADPDQIVVCAGFRSGLAIVCHTLRTRGAGRIAVEDPGLPRSRETVAATGLDVAPLPVDERGAVVDGAAGSRPDALLLTPAHQFPLGQPLAGERRRAAVAWARSADGFLLEDDYDGEFHYDASPTAAMHGLDPERVVYLGTASKTLAPGVRLGWIVAPPELAHGMGELQAAHGAGAPVLDQLALAALIADGAFERHVRRVRAAYRRRRELLRDALARRCPRVEVARFGGGLHAVVRMGAGTRLDERELEERLAAAGVGVHGLHRYRADGMPRRGAEAGLLVAYTPAAHRYEAAVEALCTALTEVAH